MSRALCLLLVLAVTCRVGLASGCRDRCPCDVASCQTCSYNVTLKSDAGVTRVTVCCDQDVNEMQWTKTLSNESFYEVSVNLSRGCNSSNFNFNFPMLNTTSLILTNNSLTNLTLGVNGSSLQEINLSSNKLRLIPEKTFNNMTNLKKLDLSRNDIINILPETFNGLSKLEFLDLSGNSISMLSDALTPLKSLQHLNLSGNNIEFIHKNYFKNWLLQHLDVSHNNLLKVSPGALQALPNLARLMLGDNPRLGGPALLVGSGRRLQQVDAARTGLLHVPEAFTHSVRFLSLVGNRIQAVRRGDLDSYPLLQSLDISDNKIAAVEDDSLGRLEMLLFLNFNRNSLTSVPKSLPDELKYLSLNDNAIQNLTVTDFRNLPNLRILLLPNNEIQYIQDHAFDDLLSLEMLDLSNNPLKALSRSAFEGPASLRDLRLCQLALPAGEGFPLPAPARVAMLHLARSPGLARTLLADPAALAALSQLQYLDLRMNNLSQIRNDLLFYLGQLKTLRLHGNGINCSAELWLKDWLNWNGSLTDGETCYYSTSEMKEEASKYNCTFSETFTISESLPPVNLYSTEMINKLLRYYGYLGNKTEEVSNKHDKEKFDEESPSYVEGANIEDNTLDNVLKIANRSLRKEIKQKFNETNHETLKHEKSNWYSKEDLRRLQNEHILNNRFLDTDSNTNTPKDMKTNSIDDVPSTRRKYSSGKRLNTPANITKKIKPHSQYNIPTSSATTAKTFTAAVENATVLGTHIESSPYQSLPTNYAPFLGTAAVCSLIVLSLVLWVSFRLRHRRRQAPPEERDQIEVSNISGAVLW